MSFWHSLFRKPSASSTSLKESIPLPQRVEEEQDLATWFNSVSQDKTQGRDSEGIRHLARKLAETHPYGRNVLQLYRHYVLGVGMSQEVRPRTLSTIDELNIGEQQATSTVVEKAGRLWKDFLKANQWDFGQRKDWEFCTRTWRDGECFLRMFRQPTWPPKVCFIDPERIAPDVATGLPTEGIETDPQNVEVAISYLVHDVATMEVEVVPADRVLHCKIGVDGNVKRGVSILLLVLDILQKYQSWLEVELVHRKVSSSVVLVRKHQGNSPMGVSSFADSVAQKSQISTTSKTRQTSFKPGTIIDAQGVDYEFISPNTHFSDAAILGRTLLLAVAAGTGLPEFMLTADAANGNYASTLVAEGPAVKNFASWQSFFAGQWQMLFQQVMREAVRLGLLTVTEAHAVELQITPPSLAVRNRKEDAEADAVYYDRGAISQRELARRDRTDPDQMRRERQDEVRPH